MMYDEDDDEEELEATPDHNLLSPHLRSVLLFLLLWQFLFNLSDAGLSAIIIFIHHLLKLIHSLTNNQLIAEWIASFPLTIYRVHNEIFGNDIKFIEYVICSKCHSLYDPEKCIITSGSNRSSRTCEFIQFPNHPHKSVRQPCGAMWNSTTKNYKKAISSHL